MSWSLMLSQWLSPAALHGVSHETSEAFCGPAAPKRGFAAPGDRSSVGSKPYFSEQLSARDDALLAFGVPTKTEELPITAA